MAFRSWSVASSPLPRALQEAGDQVSARVRGRRGGRGRSSVSRSRSGRRSSRRTQRRRKAGGNSRSPLLVRTTNGKARQRDPAARDGDAVVPCRRPGPRPPVAAAGQPGQLGDLELALLEDVQQVVGQVDVALVDLVDEQDARAPRRAAARCRAGRAGGSRPIAAGPRRCRPAAMPGVVQPAERVVAGRGRRAAWLRLVIGQRSTGPRPQLVRDGVGERATCRCRACR